MNKKNNVSLGLSYSLFAIYIFFSITAQRSIVGNMTLVIFVISSIVFALTKKEFKVSLYFILEIIFICYSIWQLTSGIVVNREAHIEQIYTLIIGVCFNLALYHYLLLTKDFKRMISVYVLVSALSFLFLSLLYFPTILRGRLNPAEMIGIFGAQGATALAYIAGFSLFFACWLYLGEAESKKAWLYIMYFTVIILLTATRKTLLLVAATIFFIPIFKSNYNMRKLIKQLIVFSFMAVVIYVLIMNVDFLYNVVGSRIDSAIVSLFHDEVIDGSINTRNNMVDHALMLFDQRPTYGWGLDSFRTTLSSRALNTHNNYLELLVSGGYVGSVIFFSKYLYLGWRLFSIPNIKENKGMIYSLRLLLFVILVMEYWQVTFIYRTHTIAFMFILGYVDRINTEKKQMKNTVKMTEELEEGYLV